MCYAAMVFRKLVTIFIRYCCFHSVGNEWSGYCIGVYTDALRNNGLDDEALTELYSIVDTYAGLNRLNVASGVKSDKKPWHGCGGNR